MIERRARQFGAEEHVVVPWSLQDRMIADLAVSVGRISSDEAANMPENTVKTISKGAIAEFCGPCDFYRDNQPCPAVGEIDQIRYAAREHCGWASVSGTRGYMNQDGFEA